MGNGGGGRVAASCSPGRCTRSTLCGENRRVVEYGSMNLRREDRGNPGKRYACRLSVITVLLLSCAVGRLVTPLSASDYAAKAAAETDNAAFTQTAAFTPPPTTPTLTLQPTGTPTVTATVTPTTFLSPTPGVLSCQLLWQSPRSGVHYDQKQNFNMGWNVINNGTVEWDPRQRQLRVRPRHQDAPGRPRGTAGKCRRRRQHRTHRAPEGSQG